MFEFLESLRKKPERVKRTIVFCTSCIITLIIFGAWAMSLSDRFGKSIEKQSASASDTISQSKDSLTQSFEEVRDKVSDVFIQQ